MARIDAAAYALTAIALAGIWIAITSRDQAEAAISKADQTIQRACLQTSPGFVLCAGPTDQKRGYVPPGE